MNAISFLGKKDNWPNHVKVLNIARQLETTYCNFVCSLADMEYSSVSVY